MTIDEAINIAKSDIKYNKSIGCDTSYEEQVTEWLEELKANKATSAEVYEQGYKRGYKNGYKNGYDKAIDDFAILMKETLNLAEQLKVGKNNGTDNQ